MIDSRACEWLIENGGVTACYRVYRELLHDEYEAKKLEEKLLENDEVKKWLTLLKPETPPQHRWMVHGSFDFCLENAMSKVIQLGLHGELEPVADAVGYYIDYIKRLSANRPFRTGENYDALMAANFLCLADIKDDMTIDFMLGMLDEIYRFMAQKNFDIYLSPEERRKLKGIPPNWKNTEYFIRKELTDKYGFCYPLICDIVGLHKLYRLNNPEVDKKINTIIANISTDDFHSKITDGYGILIAGEKHYYSMGWDPKYPGWYDVAGYLENGGAPRLLFFAQYITKYPAALQTKWFGDLIDHLEKYKTENGTYLFPAGWLKETSGYAVMGSHLSFGENRRKKNWCEIESTLYMQLLKQNV